MKTIKVKGCRSCPFHIENYRHLSNDCIYPGQENGINRSDAKTYPSTCPLKKEPIKIELDNENRS